MTGKEKKGKQYKLTCGVDFLKKLTESTWILYFILIPLTFVKICKCISSWMLGTQRSAALHSFLTGCRVLLLQQFLSVTTMPMVKSSLPLCSYYKCNKSKNDVSHKQRHQHKISNAISRAVLFTGFQCLWYMLNTYGLGYVNPLGQKLTIRYLKTVPVMSPSGLSHVTTILSLKILYWMFVGGGPTCANSNMLKTADSYRDKHLTAYV